MWIYIVIVEAYILVLEWTHPQISWISYFEKAIIWSGLFLFALALAYWVHGLQLRHDPYMCKTAKNSYQ